LAVLGLADVGLAEPVELLEVELPDVGLGEALAVGTVAVSAFAAVWLWEVAVPVDGGVERVLLFLPVLGDVCAKFRQPVVGRADDVEEDGLREPCTGQGVALLGEVEPPTFVCFA
jgi:hypothetical protein